jgi:hypothetical protein
MKEKTAANGSSGNITNAKNDGGSVSTQKKDFVYRTHFWGGRVFLIPTWGCIYKGGV